MAISPLALGIGLQGKYDYKQQAALEMSRQRGRAKAEAAEAEARAKKRAPYERALMKVDTSGLLPYQAKLIKEKYADALQSFEDNPDDYSQHAASMQDINSSSKAFRDQAENYKRLSLTRDRMPSDEEALTIIGTLSDPKAIQEGLSKLGPASSVQFANDQFLFSNPKYQGIGDSISKFVKASMFDPEQGVNEFTIGDRKYGGADINTQVPGIITENIMRTDNLRQSAINDYLRYAQQNNIQYDFSTPESTNEFLNNTTKYVNDNAKKYIDTLSKQYGGSKTQFSTYINNAPPLTPGEIGAPAQVGVRVVYSGGQRSDVDFSSTSLGFLPRLDDFTMTLPTSVGTFDAETGDQVPDAGNLKATYNGADAHYVASKDVKIPSHWQGYPNGGGAKFIPEKNIKKGQLVDDSEIDALKKQKALDVKFVVFGLTDEGDSIYRTYDEAGIVPILQRSKADKEVINKAIKDANTKYRDAKAKLYGTSEPAPTPAPKIDIPTQQDDVKKATTPNKAATTTTTKQPTAPKGTSTSTRRTPEADAAKEALRKKLQGK